MNSFAGVDVVPLIEDSNDFQINDDEIRIDVYRSSGAGGQHVNTTDSAVRVTHIPTGIVVACPAERSQLQNKIRALGLLKSKLILLEKEEKLKQEHEQAMAKSAQDHSQDMDKIKNDYIDTSKLPKPNSEVLKKK